MLVFQSISKTFPSGISALENISFTVDKGEFIFLTGPSGAGKTTLMRLLTRNMDPSSGEILFQENNISTLKNQDLYKHKRQVGVVFQDYKLLYELNAWENIALALEILGKKESEIEQRVTDLLKLVNLTDKAFLFPSQLSGGEAQRISIARALASAPSMIFADEPTGNLDPENSLTIIKLLKKINELGTTVLVATHDQSLLDEFDKIRQIRLERGKIVKDTGANQPPAENVKAQNSNIKTKSEKPELETKKVKKDEAKKNNDKETEIEQEAQEKEEQKVKKPRISLPKIKLPFGKKKP